MEGYMREIDCIKQQKRYFSYMIENSRGEQTKVVVREEYLLNQYYECVKRISKKYTQFKGGFLGDGIDSVTNRATHLILATVENRNTVVGYCVLEEGCYSTKENEKDLHVLQIAVDPKYTGKGVGKAMMGYIEHHCKGFKYITAEANNNNKISKALFTNLGYKAKQLKNHNQTLFAKNMTKNHELHITRPLLLAPQKFTPQQEGFYARGFYK